jgi:hypothetical protein
MGENTNGTGIPMADAGENTNSNGNGMLMFQTDGQWWFVWETEGGRQDAYTVSDDLGDLDMPRAAIVEDVFRRWYGGVAQTYVVVDRGVLIGEDGWPAHPAWSADARRKGGDRC